MQFRKKAQELDCVARKAIDMQEYKVFTTNGAKANDMVEQDQSRNLLVRSVAYDAMSKSLILPSQEIKTIVQDHATAKSIKVGSIAIPEEERRRKPDISCGLYVTNEVRARA